MKIRVLGLKQAFELLLQRLRNYSFVAKNSVWLLSSEAVAKLVLFALVIILARYLGAEGYGKLQFALSFAGIFALMMDLGFNTLSAREIARERQKYELYVPNVCFIKLCLFAASIVFLAVGLFLLGKPFEIIILSAMACIYYLFFSFVEFFKSIFQAFEKMWLHALSRLFYCFLLFIGLGLLVLRQFGVAAIMLGYVFVIFVTFIFTLFLMLNWIGAFQLKLDFGFLRKLIRTAIPFMLIYFAAIINFRVDVVMISLLLDDASVGFYSIASNLLIALAFIPSFCCTAVYPSLNSFFKANTRKLLLMFKGVFWLMLLIGAFCAAGVFFASKFAIPLLFGQEFAPSIPLLQILSISFFLSFGISFMGHTCLAIDRQFFYAKAVGLFVLLNILLNYFLILRVGISGSAIATVITQILQFILLFFFLAFHGFFFFSSVPAEPKLR